MPDEPQLRSLTERQIAESIAAVAELADLVGQLAPSADPNSPTVRAIGAVAAKIEALGARHVHERIRRQLDVPVQKEVVIIVWPGEGCPGPVTNHAHILFPIEGVPAEPPGGQPSRPS